MNRIRSKSFGIPASGFALAILAALICANGHAADADALADQVKALQKQVAELAARMNAVASPQIVAAGTATFTLRAEQDNATFTRVKLNADIVARLGTDYIVIITPRFPAGGYPYFVPYWKPANDGFDVTLVDTSMGNGSTASYDNRNKSFPIDWIVVKK